MAAPGGTGVSRSVHRGHRGGEPGEADARISPGSATGVVTFPLRAECSSSAATLCRRSRPSAAASTRRPRTSRPRTSGTPPSPGYGGQFWASDLGSQAGVRASEEYRVRMLAGCHVGAASGVLVGVSGRSVDEALVAGEEQVKGFTWARRSGQRCRHSWAAGYDRVRLTDVPGWVGDVRLLRWRLPAEAAHATAARAAAGDGRPASSRWSNSARLPHRASFERQRSPNTPLEASPVQAPHSQTRKPARPQGPIRPLETLHGQHGGMTASPPAPASGGTGPVAEFVTAMGRDRSAETVPRCVLRRLMWPRSSRSASASAW
ncbi:hypothetical protein SUDANB91_05795 [Streptomyces sp. SudanB91_2054]